MLRKFYISFLMIVMIYGVLWSQGEITIDSRTFGAIEARDIGPAVMSGRVSSIDAVNNDRRIIYIGAASGGLWKSVNGGTSFKPIFDKYNQSIGNIAIDQAHPDTVWVGTGEPWVRNSVSVGDGIYKTTDGGDNWEFLGLPNSERISKIVINPSDPSNVFVGVLGKLWSDSDERGVYVTKDGGKTWNKVLYVNEKTGCADIAIDPQNPKIIYAAMWEFRRLPYFFKSGGPGSSLYKSEDGGKTWNKITKGFPDGELGRIAIAIAPSKTNIVYVTVEAEKGGFYRSSDYGNNWTLMSTNPVLVQRPFYFSLLAVDPKDYNRIYRPGFALAYSEDSGKSWSSTGDGVHSDYHAIWIAPNEPNYILLGTDGGVYASQDRGATWNFFLNLPLSQFYHISYDMERPYNVYGGLQDNGSWMGPSQSPGGIENKDWKNVGFGDGFYAFPDPTDKDIVYSQWQGGNIARFHKSLFQSKMIKAFPHKGEPDYRWNWNTPFIVGAKSKALFVGSQFLLKSTDKGESWKRISPDLTTNNLAKEKQNESGGLTLDNSTAENHCTIFSISESPIDDKVIWAGTDDGNLQVTKDGGKTWKNVVKNIPGLPPETWCMCISAGNFSAATAFAAFSGHQTGDTNHYVFGTTDYGQTWRSISGNGMRGFARVIRQDLVKPDLLFLGTEFGLYISIDSGKHWAQFTGNLPSVPVFDIAIHPREGDLILATHGRGVMIIDDISPFRAITPDALNSDLYIFPSRPLQIKIPRGEQTFPGGQEYVGSNPTSSATITYYMKKRHVLGDLNVEVFGPDGKLLTKMPGGNYKGLNRVKWAMRMKPPKVAPSPSLAGQALFGPMVPEGTYTFKITKGDKVYNGSFKLIPDQSEPYSKADRDLQYKTMMKLYNMQADLAYTAETVDDLRKQIDDRSTKLDSMTSLGKTLRELSHRLDSLHNSMMVKYVGAGLTSEERLRERVVGLYGNVSNYGGAPTRSQIDLTGKLESEIKDVDVYFKNITDKEISTINSQLQSVKVEPLKKMTREEFDKKEESGGSAGKPLWHILRFPLILGVR
jgi:photosystem II stability/assembly factor-like uncharacterized protein